MIMYLHLINFDKLRLDTKGNEVLINQQFSLDIKRERSYLIHEY